MFAWLRRWWALVIIWTGAVLGFFGQHFFRVIDDNWRWAWAAVGILGALAAGGAATIDRILREKALVDMRAEQRLQMEDALDPVIESVAALAAEPPDRRPTVYRSVIEKAVTAGAQVIGPARTRVCYFEIEVQPVFRAVPRAHAGRSGRPKTSFTGGTPAGDAVLDLLLHDGSLFIRDLDVEQPPGWDESRQRPYKTFIAVPARARGWGSGMLTADAEKPGDLNEDDVVFLRVLGTIIAIADLIVNPPSEGTDD